MANDHIATYLNDHLSGSVVAVELMENYLSDGRLEARTRATR